MTEGNRDFRKWYHDGTQRFHETTLESRRERNDELTRESLQSLRDGLSASDDARRRGDRLVLILIVVTGVSVIVTAGTILIAFVH